MGLWHLYWDSSVECPHPQLGVVMERTCCRSPSDTQLEDISICSRTGLSPKGCRMGLRAPGETQPCVQGRGVLPVTAAGVLHQQCSPKAGNAGMVSSAPAGFPILLPPACWPEASHAPEQFSPRTCLCSQFKHQSQQTGFRL